MAVIKGFFNFLRDIYCNREILIALVKNDFKARYITSFLGSVWAFVQPLVTILVFWFVFQVGFRSAPVSSVPYIVWFAPAYLIWAYFSEALMATTNSLREYSYLVKQVDFRVSLIPLVKIASSSVIHIGFIIFILLLVQVYKVGLSIFSLQVVYYFLSTAILLTGLGWLLSAISLFAGDVANIISVFIQIGFWATPICWSPENMSSTVQNVLKINPLFYICRGYRDSFIDGVWFWQRGYTNLYFWVVTVLLFVFGALIFKKLRPQFADVL